MLNALYNVPPVRITLFALNALSVITLEMIIFATLSVFMGIFQTSLLISANCALMIAQLVTVTEAVLLAMPPLTTENLTRVLQDAFLCKATSNK